MRVLVVDGSRGQTHTALSTVRALAEAGHRVDLAEAGEGTLAGRSRHVHERFVVPGVDDTGFAVAVRALLATGYDACFPTSDGALVALDWPGAELVDKRTVHKRFERAGARQPRSWSFDDGAALLAAADVLPYPLAVKAATRVGDGSPTVRRVEGPADLEPLRGASIAVYAEEWLVGEQTALCGVLHGGRLVAAVHQHYLRTWPPQVGDASAAVTTEPDLALEEQVADALHDHDGVFQVELRGGTVHDVNPRVYGSISLAVHAGVNLPDLAARLHAGEAPPAEVLRAPAGVRHRWVEGDLRHVAAGLRAGDLSVREAAHILRPDRGTVHPDVHWRDPRPTVARLRHAAQRLRGRSEP